MHEMRRLFWFWFGFECERIDTGKMVDEFMPGVMILMFYLYNFLHNFLKQKTSIPHPPFSAASLLPRRQKRNEIPVLGWSGFGDCRGVHSLKFLDKMIYWAYDSGSELGKGVKGDT